MKLYLSSDRLGDTPEKLVELVSNNKNFAVIANAMDFVENLEREESVKREVEDLRNLGLFPEEIDLRDYFGKQKELSNGVIPGL